MNEDQDRHSILAEVPFPVWGILLFIIWAFDLTKFIAPVMVIGVTLLTAYFAIRWMRKHNPPQAPVQIAVPEEVAVRPIIHPTRVEIKPRHYNTQQNTDHFEVMYDPASSMLSIKNIKQEKQYGGTFEWEYLERQATGEQFVYNRQERTTLSVHMTPQEANQVFARINAEEITDIRQVQAIAANSSPTPPRGQERGDNYLIGG